MGIVFKNNQEVIKQYQNKYESCQLSSKELKLKVIQLMKKISLK